MSEYFEYIDAYFQKELSDPEREEFEKRCVADEEFANDVALYISSRSALRDMLLEEKKIEWLKLENKDNTSAAPVKRMNYTKWIAYAAAACLILAIFLFPLLSNDSPQELAKNYVEKRLEAISLTMDASTDSLQLGSVAYNKGDYETAIKIFQDVYSAHPENSDALRYLGQTQLVSGNFDKAISAFEELAQKPTESNWGPFLKAIALMQRNQGNDLQVAKDLLQKVASEDLNGKKEAEKWLKKWPE